MNSLLRAFLIILPFSVSTLYAQPDIGLQAYHDYHGGDLDHINMDNGNLTVTIPIVSYPQRGSALKMDYALVFNGTGMTNYKETFTVPLLRSTEYIYVTTWNPQSWTAGLNAFTTSDGPALYDMQDLGSTGRQFEVTTGGGTVYQGQQLWSTPDGSTHFAVQSSIGQIAFDGSNIQGNYLIPGSIGIPNWQCVWDCTLPGVAAQSTVAATRDGITYFGADASTTGPIRMDADGNYLSSDGANITDTTGRVIPFPSATTTPTSAQAAACTGPLAITSISTWTPPGYTVPYLFCYATITTNWPTFTSTTNRATESTSTKTVLQSLVLPNGQSWIFEYNEAATNCPYSSAGITNIGDLTHITFPTGGTIDYTYTCIVAPGATGISPSTAVTTTAVSSRTINANDGFGSHSWTYAYANGKVTITDPNGNDTVQTISFGSVSSGTNALRVTNNYSGSASSGVVIKSDVRVYPPQYSTSRSGMPLGFPLFPVSETVTLNNGLSTQTVFQYCCDIPLTTDYLFPNYYPVAASYGKVTDTKVYDYAASGAGTLLKETATSYLFQSNSSYINPGFFDLISSQTTYDRSGNELAHTSNAYDGSSRVTSGIATLSGSQMSTPLYSVFGHATSQTHWLNTGSSSPATTTTYYDTGTPYQLTDPLGHTTSTYYCTGPSPTTLPCTASAYMGALPTVIANALNQQASFTYRTDTGQKFTSTDPNSQTTTYTYNDPLNRITNISYPDKGATSVQYNDTGTLGVTVTNKITASLSKVAQTNVDGFGREYETELLSDPSGITYTRTSYDALGRTYQAWNPTRCDPMAFTSCSGETTWGITTHQYDALGREILMIPPDGTAIANNIATSYNGNSTTVTDEASNSRTTTADALGRVTKVSEGSVGYITNYGGVTGTGCSSSSASDSSSPWRVRRFTYDSLSRLLTARNPETGTIAYGYNLDGVMTSKTDARGITTYYTPDSLNRITQKSYSDSEPTINYSYDAFGTNNYGIGRRTGMTDASGSTAWTYDTMGRTWSEAKTINGITKTTSSVYNLDGSATQITYPAETSATGAPSVVLSITPNSAGQTIGVTDTTNGINYAQSISYAPTGQISTALYGFSSVYAGIAETNTYNSRGQPIRLQACGLTSCADGTGSSSPYLLDISYNYGLGASDNGDVLGISNNKDATRSQSFTYTSDGLNRLQQASSGTAWGVAFTYDPWGNLYQTNPVSGTAVNPMTLNQQSTVLNQFLLNGYTYDAAGNVLSDGLNYGCGNSGYTWNAEEQMSCAAGASYTYDGDGARVEKMGGFATSTLYWGGMAESDLSGNVTSEYIFAGGRRIARRDVATGNVHYYFQDMLGSSNVVANSSGAIENESDFYPFGGESVVSQDVTNQKFKFTGKERDPESGLDDFGARYYNSIVGRFQSPDWANSAEPVPYARIGIPQSLNLYAYTQNNPESSPDLDGHLMSLQQYQASLSIGGSDNVGQQQQMMIDAQAGYEDAVQNNQTNASSQSSSQSSTAAPATSTGSTAQQQNQSSTATTNPNAAAEQHQYDLVVNRVNKLLGTKDAAEHIDSDGNLDGGNYAFPINHNDKSDAAFQRSLNKALGETDGDTGAHGGLTPPTHRLGFSTSLHHDNDALHVDHFNGAKFPVGTLLHAIVDVGIGHLMGPNFAFSYSGVNQ